MLRSSTTSSIRWWLEVLWRRGLFPVTPKSMAFMGFQWSWVDSMDQPQRTGPTRPKSIQAAFAHAPRATLEAREHVPGISCSINLRDQRRGTMLDMGYRGWSHRCLGPYNGGCLILGGGYFHFNWLVFWAQLLGKKESDLFHPIWPIGLQLGLYHSVLLACLAHLTGRLPYFSISHFIGRSAIGGWVNSRPSTCIQVGVVGVKHRGRFLRMLPSWLWLITMAIVIFSLRQFRGTGNGNSKLNVDDAFAVNGNSTTINIGMSENGVYPQWNSHLVGIMIMKTIGCRYCSC